MMVYWLAVVLLILQDVMVHNDVIPERKVDAIWERQ